MQEFCELFGGKPPEKVVTPASCLSLSASLERPIGGKLKDDLLQSVRPPSLHNGLIGQGIKSVVKTYQLTQVWMDLLWFIRLIIIIIIINNNNDNKTQLYKVLCSLRQ